jgi:Fe-S cluster assembly protein SufD
MSASAIDTDLLERAVGKLPRDSLMPARQAALSRFRQTGFPTTRHEDWKYTNLAPAVELSNLWLREGFAKASQATASARMREYAATLASQIDAHWIVIGNGVIQRESLAAVADLDLAGLDATSAAEAAAAAPALAGDAMSLFNAALLRDVLHVRVAPAANLMKPLGLLVFDEGAVGSAVSQPRIVINAGDNARIKIVEVHASAGDGGQFANAVTEVALAQGAIVDFVRIQERQAHHYQVGKLNVRVGRDATFNHAAFDLGGGLIRNDVAVDIAAPGAAVALHGLYLAGGKQHIDNHTRVDHRVGPATSTEEYRGILNDRARCVWNGKAIVHKGADGTDAHQANHNLLLSDKAEIDTKPELEIYADDVKCSHGATVGQLDEAALFYLRTRGLSLEEAAHALTRAFASTIVARSPVAEAQEYLERAIETRLQDLIGESPVRRAPTGHDPGTATKTRPVGARPTGDRQEEQP